MTGRHQCDETEHNFVADAFNWEQRVKGELTAARTWTSNWGSVFAPNSPKSYSEKIAKLENRMKELPVQALMSNIQISILTLCHTMTLGGRIISGRAMLCLTMKFVNNNLREGVCQRLVLPKSESLDNVQLVPLT